MCRRVAGAWRETRHRRRRTEYDWIYQPQYGETNEEIRDAVMKEWLSAGAPDCDPGGLWFALPSPYVGNRDQATLQYIREFFTLDLKAPAHGEALITRVLAQLRAHPQT